MTTSKGQQVYLTNSECDWLKLLHDLSVTNQKNFKITRKISLFCYQLTNCRDWKSSVTLSTPAHKCHIQIAVTHQICTPCTTKQQRAITFLPNKNQHRMRDAQVCNSPQVDWNAEVMRHGWNHQLSVGFAALLITCLYTTPTATDAEIVRHASCRMLPKCNTFFHTQDQRTLLRSWLASAYR